jgi:hypothetical protein
MLFEKKQFVFSFLVECIENNLLTFLRICVIHNIIYVVESI